MGDILKDTLKLSLKLFAKLFLCNVLSMVIVISLLFLANIFFTENAGYHAFGSKGENSEPEFLYEYRFNDGEDTQYENYLSQGYTIHKKNIRTDVSKAGKAFVDALSQIVCILLVVMVLYSVLWNAGNKDANRVRFNRITYDKYKGIKVGLIASAPYILFSAAMLLLKNFPVVMYKLINSVFYIFIQLICGNAVTFGEVGSFKIFILILIQLLFPVFAWVSYQLGYKDIILSDKLIYKKGK